MTKISGSFQTPPHCLKEGKPTAGPTSPAFLLHGPCSQVPLLQKHSLHLRHLRCPHIYKEIRAWRVSNRFLTISPNLASFCLSDTTHCDASLLAPPCLFLCQSSSHKALSQVMGSSAGASKEKGGSETIITLLEPKTAKQEVLWFKVNNNFPWVEKQHFTSYSSMNEQTP